MQLLLLANIAQEKRWNDKPMALENATTVKLLSAMPKTSTKMFRLPALARSVESIHGIDSAKTGIARHRWKNQSKCRRPVFDLVHELRRVVHVVHEVCAKLNILIGQCFRHSRIVLSSFFRCRHGGHAHHMLGWFANQKTCPVSGCNCECEFDGVRNLNRPALYPEAGNDESTS
jgi:hypothetical protein